MIRRHPRLAALLLSMLAAAAGSTTARADEIEGTAYTVLYRTDPPQTAAPYGTRRMAPGRADPRQGAAPGTMSLVDSQRNRELAQAGYDPQLRGYLFRLPMAVEPGRTVCLVLRGQNRVSVPVREERQGDDGYAFANPLWQAETARMGDLVKTRADLGALRVRLEAESAELAAFDAGGAPAVCVAGPPEPEPPRPASALSARDAAALAGPVCATKWQARLGAGIDAGRLYADARMGADWADRAAGRPAADAAPELTIVMAENDLQLVRDAAVKGSIFLQHADGVARFATATQACKTAFVGTAASATTQWEARRDTAARAPETARRACETRQARAQQLRRGQAAAADYRRALEEHLSQLERNEPSATASTRIDRVACRETP